ncbi:Uncharacterised protein [Chryseobacterium carnipullorum]|uniref:Uncharacterized protein n=1 Tax=Chryseobacterium carnipullorum TaxID=1124835 RepID=A0A376DTC5_CHRCU|nr:Uncharacterised protein [Chryseobacterium carnipullorum]
MSSSKNSWLVPVAFINIYVIWGITFLAIVNRQQKVDIRY